MNPIYCNICNCNLWMYIRLLWYIVIKCHFLEYQCLSPSEKFIKLAREENTSYLSFVLCALSGSTIYTIQSKIERMLFKSLCLLSPYMHHFISSIIITVLCVSKITCPCFPISGFIKIKFASKKDWKETWLICNIQKLVVNHKNYCIFSKTIAYYSLFLSLFFQLSIAPRKIIKIPLYIAAY